MAITYRKAQRVDFEIFKPTIKSASYYDVGAPPARVYDSARRFEFESETSIRPDGINSAEAFSIPTLSVSVLADSILSGELFESPLLVPSLLVYGIPSEEAFASPLLLTIIAGAGSITSGETFGYPLLIQSLWNVGDIASAEVLGDPGVQLILVPPGIASQEAIGSPSFAPTLRAAGIPSEEHVHGPLLRLPKVLRPVHTEVPSSGLRFGLKKLNEITSMKVGLKSKFGLKPLDGEPTKEEMIIEEPLPEYYEIIAERTYSLWNYVPSFPGVTPFNRLRVEPFNLEITEDADTYLGAWVDEQGAYFWEQLFRVGMIFDTSSIPQDFIIDRAEIFFYTFYQNINFNIPPNFTDGALRAVLHNPLDKQNIVPEDFFRYESTLLSDGAIIPVEPEQEYFASFMLNPVGLQQIIKGGRSVFGFMTEVDRINGNPEGHGYPGYHTSFAWLIPYIAHPAYKTKLTVWRPL